MMPGMGDLARMSHKDLILWQKSMLLAVEIYRLTATLPRHESFGLTSQLRRASISVPSNIAEGSARKSTKEFVHFLHIARGSIAELETQLMLVYRIGYTTEERLGELEQLIEEIGRILNSVISGLNRRLG
jgi:four helix bundle protein